MGLEQKNREEEIKALKERARKLFIFQDPPFEQLTSVYFDKAPDGDVYPERVKGGCSISDMVGGPEELPGKRISCHQLFQFFEDNKRPPTNSLIFAIISVRGPDLPIALVQSLSIGLSVFLYPYNFPGQWGKTKEGIFLLRPKKH